MKVVSVTLYMGIQYESIQSAPKIAHLRNLYEASVTAALFMIIIITFEVTIKSTITKMMEK